MALKLLFNPTTGKFDYVNESTAISIPEYNTDPVSPSAEEVWVRKSTVGGIAPGQSIGLLLALTYASSTYLYELSYRTIEGTTKRVVLT